MKARCKGYNVSHFNEVFELILQKKNTSDRIYDFFCRAFPWRWTLRVGGGGNLCKETQRCSFWENLQPHQLGK